MKQALLISLLFLLAAPVMAAQDGSFIYNKTVLKIIPKPGTVEPESAAPPKPADKKDAVASTSADSLMPALKRVTKEFTVEMRQQSFLDQKDFIARQPFTDKEGMLILVDPPAEAAVKGTRMIASADVLFVDADGVIVKIAPELNLSKLSEPIPSTGPIHAFVYLKSGAAANNDIRIGDRVENTYFKTHPVVIE